MKTIRLQIAFAVAVAATLLSWPTSAFAVAGDEHWGPQFAWAGTTNVIYSMTTHAGRLYAAGAGGTTNTTLSVWDGTQWTFLGQFSGANPVVYDLAFVGNTLYAAGFFTNLNGLNIKGLARWDGLNWSSIGYNGNAYALLVSGGDLYVGGSFTNAGAVAATNIARWDGSAW